MGQTRKNLRTSSIVVLALAGLSLLNILFELFFGKLSRELKNAAIPEGAPDNIVLILQVFIVFVSILLLLPQVYIGIKGLKIANKPNSSRAHIIWGIILIVCTFFELGSPFIALIQGKGEVFGNVSEMCSIVVDIVVLFEYVKYAIYVRKGV